MATRADAGSEQIRRKGTVVEEIRERLAGADAALLTEYRGLKVTEIAALRAALRPMATEYKVFKNTLARRAAEEAGLTDLIPMLEGPVAIAFVHGDAVSAAKALRDFARSTPALTIKGGLLGQRVLFATDVEALAEVPPREVLLARLAGGFQAPLTKAAGLFQAFTRNMAYGVKALIDQRIEGGEAMPQLEEPAAEHTEAASSEETPAAGAPSEEVESGDSGAGHESADVEPEVKAADDTPAEG